MFLLLLWLLCLPLQAQTLEASPSPSPSPTASVEATPEDEPEQEFTVKFSGYLKTDLIADEAPIASRNAFVTAQIPVNGLAYVGSKPTTTFYTDPRLLYQESRVRLDIHRQVPDEQETPLPFFRDIRFFAEADFLGSGGLPRLRHLYAQFPHLLIGRTDSVFMASGTQPETLDNQGPNASSNARREQVRVWTDLTDELQVAASMEVLDAIITATGVTQAGDVARRNPDYVAHLRWHSGPSSLQLAGVARTIQVRNAAGAVLPTGGWGLSLGGRYQLGDDDLRFQYNFGNGIGDYIQDLIGTRAEVGFDASGQLQTQFARGGFLAYRHWWTQTLRSNFFVSQVTVSLLAAPAESTYRRAGEFGFNLLYDVTPSLTVGAEYLNGSRVNPNGSMGFGQRFQLSTRLNF